MAIPGWRLAWPEPAKVGFQAVGAWAHNNWAKRRSSTSEVTGLKFQAITTPTSGAVHPNVILCVVLYVLCLCDREGQLQGVAINIDPTNLNI